jgi:Mn-dependent transcriptional regulator
MSHLVDTAEMYLKAVYELEEEGIPPLRARLVERLEQSKPTVSETVARLERDGLMHVKNNRIIALTDEGKRQATRVMRKHRLAERLLLDVLGMPWSEVHDEACRWEHVMSDAVEERLETLLERTDVDPYGNPIPGIEGVLTTAVEDDLLSVKERIARGDVGAATVVRIAEGVQTDPSFLDRLAAAGIVPGSSVAIADADGRVTVAADGAKVELSDWQQTHLFVR